MQHFIKSLADQARAQRGAAADTPVVFMIGNGLRGYSTWAGSPPSGVMAFARELQRLEKDPSLNIKVFVVPEYWTSQRCADLPSLLSLTAIRRCIDCGCKLEEVRMPSTEQYREAPVAGPGFNGEVQLPPLMSHNDIATTFLDAVEKETPGWEKEIKVAQEHQEKVKGYRKSRKSGEGRQKQKAVRVQRGAPLALTFPQHQKNARRKKRQAAREKQQELKARYEQQEKEKAEQKKNEKEEEEKKNRKRPSGTLWCERRN
jgi:hypothetical protein